MLPEARRPSRIPRWRTRRLGCLEDDVGRVARDIGGRHHRNADIGRVQRGRVVDAVAHVSDDVSASLERENDPVLLRRRDAREHRRLLREMAERRVVDPRDVLAGHDLLIVQPMRSADVTGDQLVIARQDLDGDAVALELRQHLADIREDRIGEADEAGQHEIGLVVARVGVRRGSSQR